MINFWTPLDAIQPLDRLLTFEFAKEICPTSYSDEKIVSSFKEISPAAALLQKNAVPIEGTLHFENKLIYLF